MHSVYVLLLLLYLVFLLHAIVAGNLFPTRINIYICDTVYTWRFLILLNFYFVVVVVVKCVVQSNLVFFFAAKENF